MSFDGEINKLQGFKKLKKPKELEEQFKNGIKKMKLRGLTVSSILLPAASLRFCVCLCMCCASTIVLL